MPLLQVFFRFCKGPDLFCIYPITVPNRIFIISFQQAAASSFSYSSAGDHSHSREENRDGTTGEVTGQYSYLTPEGKSITVRYRAGVNGFEILNPEEVYPQAF